MNSRIQDLHNQRFGSLLVISFVARIKGRSVWNCLCDCGNHHMVSAANLKRGSVKSCGCLRKLNKQGEKNIFWRGGRRYCNGYIYLYKPDHPFAWKTGYVAEHRLVMEQCLGRYLNKNETIHHKNGDRTYNSIENLELRVGNHGKHQSITDLIKWAKQILTQYEPSALNKQ